MIVLFNFKKTFKLAVEILSLIVMKILPGIASNELARDLASLLSLPLVEVETKTFYEGETYLRILEYIK